jgi:hypothetical protein
MNYYFDTATCQEIWIVEFNADYGSTNKSLWNVDRLSIRAKSNLKCILTMRNINNWVTVGYAPSRSAAELLADALKDDYEKSTKAFGEDEADEKSCQILQPMSLLKKSSRY